MDKEVYLKAMQLASKQMGITESEFVDKLVTRIMNDGTVPEELKKALYENLIQKNKKE